MTDHQVARAENLIDLGRYAEARAVLVRLAASEPESPSLNLLLAEAANGCGSTNQALQACERVIAAEPENAEAFELIARIHQAGDRPRQALGAAREAVRLAPFSPTAHALVATEACRVPGCMAESNAAVARVLVLAPHAAQSHFVAGFVAHERGLVKEARAAYRQALSIDPLHTAAHNNLAVLGGSTRLGRAARGFSTVLALDPQDGLAKANLDVLVTLFGQRLYRLAATSLVAGLLVSVLVPGTMVRLGAAAAIMAVVGGYLLLTWRGLPRSTRRYLPAAFRAQRSAVVDVSLAAALVGMAVAATLVPLHWDRVPVTYLVWLMILGPWGLVHLRAALVAP